VDELRGKMSECTEWEAGFSGDSNPELTEDFLDEKGKFSQGKIYKKLIKKSDNFYKINVATMVQSYKDQDAN
jgi:hypothetical protein